MSTFNKDMSIEEIIKVIESHISSTFETDIGKIYLQYKLQQQLLNRQEEQQKILLDQQDKYNEKQLFLSRLLVYVTGALVIATLLLVKMN